MQTREAIRYALKQIIEDEMGEDCPALDDDLDLRAGLALDSVDLVGVVMGLEREYRVRLSMEELAGINTVGELISLLQAKPGAAPDAPARDVAA